MDVDLVVSPTATQLRAFVESIAQPGIYVSADAGR
jgi:hypothetical protein